MNIRVLEPRIVTRHVARVMVGALEVTYDLLELLEEMQGAGDGFFVGVLINDRKQGDALEERGLASRSIRGSYHAGPKLDAWLKAAHERGIARALAESHERAYPGREK